MLTQQKDLLFLYLKSLFPNEKLKLTELISCPVSCSDKKTAQIIDNHVYCLNPKCNSKFDIADIVTLYEPKLKLKGQDLEDYLYSKLNLTENIDTLLKKYYNAGFHLFPLQPSDKDDPKKGKRPIGKWKDDAVKNIEVWKGWLHRGYGLGLKLGKDSNLIAIDIDSLETYEKIKHLIGNTLHQSTKRGFGHLLYNYNSDFDNVNHDNLRDKGFEMEVRANNSYIVVAPTSVEGETRKWNNQKISNISEEFKNFLLENISKEKAKLTQDEKIQEAINKNDLGNIKLHGLEGCCNDTFIKLGGALRKQLNIIQTEYALSLFNNLLANPIPSKQVKGMIEQLNKYQCYDKQELANLILERLDIIKEASAFQLSKTLSLSQKDIEDVLNYLEKEGKIYSSGQNRYKKLQEIEWTTGFDSFGKPLNFEVPIFSKYAYLDYGDMIIIGGRTGQGKSHICANLIKMFYNKNELKSIDLISTEAGSKIGKVLEILKVPQEYVCSPKKSFKHPTEIELRDNRVTIIDWLKPQDGEYAKTDMTFEHFEKQLKKHGGLLIIFVQLRTSDGNFFAKDQIEQYSSFTMKFLYNGNDNLNPYGQTTKIRDSKSGSQFLTIPFQYDFNTKILKVKES